MREERERKSQREKNPRAIVRVEPQFFTRLSSREWLLLLLPPQQPSVWTGGRAYAGEYLS